MKYLIPFSYMLKTRYKTLAYKLAFALVYFIPLYIVTIFFQADLLLLNLVIIGTNCIYEIGYIDNDLITSTYEEKPTERLTTAESKEIWRKYLLLIAARQCIFFLIAGLLIWKNSISGLFFIFGGMSILIAYAFHNTVRSKWNVLTFFALVISKYFSVILVVLRGTEAFWACTAIFFAICLPRTIEFAAKLNIIKYDLFNKNELFRCVYYTAFLMISGLFTCYLQRINVVALIAIYYWVFRVLSFIMQYQKEKWKQKNKQV